jgi:hypothetical protein
VSKRSKFKGLACAYCVQRPATTEDHVFGRKFFLENARTHLPKAPACSTCNNEKANLENYLMIVLPFGGRHPDALENLTSLVPPRLRRNRKLHRELSTSASAHTIPLEWDKVEELFALIALGLLWHHWKIYLNQGTHGVHVVTTASRDAVYEETIFKLNGLDRTIEDVGNGTFQYERMKGIDDPALTIWRFSVYGELMVSTGDDDAPLPSQLIVITGPKAVIQEFDHLKSRLVRRTP